MIQLIGGFFVNGSNESIKAVLLHDENILPSVPDAHSTTLKETYTTLCSLFWTEYVIRKADGLYVLI